MFLPQRKRRKPKNDEQDPHCLLCVDMRPPEALNTDRPPEFGPESHAHPQDRGVNNAETSDLPTALLSHTAWSSPLQEAPQCLTFSANQHHLLLGDKMADNTRVQDVLQPSPPSPPHHPHSKHPALKSRNFDLGLPINSFTVLPPVKTPQLKAQRVNHQVCFKESAAGGGSAAGGSWEVGGVVPLSARESRGVERTEDTGGADTVTNTEPSKDTYKPIVPRTAMYCQSQETRQLLNAFTVPVLKGYEVPLGNISDTMHRTTFSIGKHWKQALRTGSEYSRHARSAPPQLPILLGTKVPIVVSGQRPL
ncbi:hypothetical protein N1851_015247 [Merluccius polli]|uniref:Uncharacterized protein n=1 Tax=Merluccius polli TaxID=89951 RepID=A0AA47MTE0_MERPO|nr:hypothetical protein N1851_015247 [Merluccius polli]